MFLRKKLLGSIEEISNYLWFHRKRSPLNVRSGSLNARWAWHICQFQRIGKRYWLFPQIKSWANWNRTYWCKAHEIFLAQIPHIVFIELLYPREEFGTAKVFVGVTENDVTVNNKGGATCNNNKKITWRFFTCQKIDSNFAIILPQKPWTKSLMPLRTSSTTQQTVMAEHFKVVWLA